MEGKDNADTDLLLRPFVEIAKLPGVSNRVRHSLGRAGAERLPFKDIGEYVACKNKTERLLKIPNLGLKSANEIIHKLNELLAGKIQLPERSKAATLSASSSYIDSLSDTVKNFTFVELVNKYPASVRTSNGVRQAWRDDNFPYETLLDYLRSGADDAPFYKLANLGKKSVQELIGLIDRYLEESDEGHAPPRKLVAGNIYAAAGDVLDPRALNVLLFRLGGKTLQEIGQAYGITRERARQIQAKATTSIYRAYSSEIEDFASKVDQLLTASNGEIYLLELAARVGLSKNEAEFLSHLALDHLQESTKLSADVLSRQSVSQGKPAWDESIDESIFSQNWPVSVQKVLADNPDIPRTYIVRRLAAKFGAQVKSGKVLRFERIPQTRKATFVMREKGGPVSPAEGVLIYRKLFGESISEHNLGSVFNRMGNALIVSRGTYALYEQIDINEDELDLIREFAFDFLANLESFYSTKLLYKEALRRLGPYLAGKLTSAYVLHGILQDDERFIIRRGLMVSIKKRVGGAVFVPLSKEITTLVEAEGPLSVPDIQGKLASHRKVLNVAISGVLNRSPEIVRVSPGLFDLASRVFEDTSQLELLKIGIAVVLHESPSTLFDLCAKLSTIRPFAKLPINHSTISSLLSNMENVVFSDAIYRVENADSEIHDYIEATRYSEPNKDSFMMAAAGLLTLTTEEAERLVEVDFRLTEEFRSITIQSGPIDDSAELSRILGSFG